jgi:hypothetical protein
MRIRHLLMVLGFALVAMLGYWLAGTAAPRKTARVEGPRESEPARRTAPADEAPPRFRRGERAPSSGMDVDAALAGALEGQRVLVFKDRAALEHFLEKAGDRIRLMGRLDSLNALRVGFSNYDDLLALLGGDEELAFVFPVSVPDLPEGSVQPGAVALGSRLLDWLGVGGENSTWGAGVRIAVLDTGVTSHPALAGSIRSFNLIDPPADPSAQNGHGTAVASVMIGSDPLTPGVAPGAEILSFRIAGETGQSDSFLLAQGIIAAVDAGADLINISMGSSGDSLLVRNAVQYALDRGRLVIAAAGNNGIDRVSYPAANEGVIAVGAVDALGNHLDFSNSGNAVDISAPGYGVNAAWTGDQAVSFSGTSASAPIVAAAIAAVMTEAGKARLTANQAWNLLSAYLNDGGAAGADPQLGAGTPDIGRVLTGKTPGVYDAALASQRILPPDATHPYGQIEILVQNRGTETLVNTAVKIRNGGTTSSVNLTSLPPDAVKTVRVPVRAGSGTLTIESRVVISEGLKDVKPSNDRRVETYVAADPK